jgi:hypothetical protein
MSIYLIVILALASVVLFIAGRRIPKWRAMAEGLAINILAASLILLVTYFSQKPWNLTPVLLGGTGALILTIPFFVLQNRRQRAELNKAKTEAQISEGQAERLLTEKNLLLAGTIAAPSAISASGLTTYARNYVEDFQRVTGREFGEYLRSFVTGSPAGSIFKVAGIDWTELFGAVVSATSERYLKLLGDPNTSFKVILLDPRCPVGLEKRVSEFNLLANGKPRYTQNHPDRVYGKIVGATKMMVEYHNKFPRQFQYKFVSELPTACWIMNGKTIILYLYSRCHKGWDSPVFIAENVPNGLYEFFDEYFDFLWQYPHSCLPRNAWSRRRRELAPLLTEFENVLRAGCSGSLHEGCAKL